MKYGNIGGLIGKTPLSELCNFTSQNNLKAKIFAKLEMKNPGGSVKDRVAFAMLRNGEKSGLIKKGTTIIEPTSGNTGIGLAMIGKELGYRVVLTMPDTMSTERRNLLEGYGAELILTEGAKGMQGAIDKANEFLKTIPDSYMPDQFGNPANPGIHYETTGPEIWEDMNGKVDIFISGVGTGGTISGVGGFLKSKNSDIKIIAVEPAGSPVLSGGSAGPHKIQGIGAGFIPEVLDAKIYDEVITVTDEEAFAAVKEVYGSDNLSVGISSGAVLAAAVKAAVRPENMRKNIIVIFPDGGDRYSNL